MPGLTLEKKQKGKGVKKNPKHMCKQGLKHGGFREVRELKIPRRGRKGEARGNASRQHKL